MSARNQHRKPSPAPSRPREVDPEIKRQEQLRELRETHLLETVECNSADLVSACKLILNDPGHSVKDRLAAGRLILAANRHLHDWVTGDDSYESDYDYDE